MLRQAEIPGPYVLVGGSFGGYNVRLFAHEYPDQVAGLVLVDSAIDLFHKEIPDSIRQANENIMRAAKLVRFLAPFGIGRIGASEQMKNLPAEERDIKLRTSNVITGCDEWQSYNTSTSQMKGWTLPPDIPLAVLSATGSPHPRAPAEDQLVAVNLQHKLHALIAGQSNNSFHYIVDSGHNITFDQPDVVIDSIRRVMESVRNHTKLTPPNQ